MATNPQIVTFADRESMAARVADLVEGAARTGLGEFGQAELALSGGSTPKALYSALAARNLSWDRVRLTLVDERWVPTNHPRSNEAFVREAFSGARDVQVSGLFNGAPSPSDGLTQGIEAMAEPARNFDAVILGMGDDGHTASWFPHADGLDRALEANDKLTAITAEKSAVTGDEVDRISLTLSAIRPAGLVILLITGETKKEVLLRALMPGPIEDLPVRAILAARPDMWICWAP
ncbi:MAG: 6-phosphogluconolactonase [Pseudomonadota bacterium]